MLKIFDFIVLSLFVVSRIYSQNTNSAPVISAELNNQEIALQNTQDGTSQEIPDSTEKSDDTTSLNQSNDPIVQALSNEANNNGSNVESIVDEHDDDDIPQGNDDESDDDTSKNDDYDDDDRTWEKTRRIFALSFIIALGAMVGLALFCGILNVFSSRPTHRYTRT